MHSTDIPVLDSERYQRVVAPALKVAARHAAKRGDPYLFNDMASMLALMRQVDILASCCAGSETPDPALELAGRGACVMALREGELPETAVEQCLEALIHASEQLAADGVFVHGEVDTVRAWQELHADHPEQGEALLERSLHTMVDAIDAWERGRR